MSRTLVLVIALAVALVPGCVQSLRPAGVTDDATAAVADVAALLTNEHDHLDPALHAGGSKLTQLAYVPIGDADAPLTFGELDVHGDLALAAILQPTGGFAVIDVADPAAPVVLGRYDGGLGYAGDVKFSPDGALAFLAMNGPSADPVENPTKIPTAGMAAGVQIVSLADPAMPALVSHYQLPPFGVHMLDTHVIGGSTYVFSIGLGGVDIARLVGAGPLATLVHVASYNSPETAGGPLGAVFGPHDVTVVDDPDLGPLLLCACGTAGVAVASIEDPAMPETLGTWTDHDGEYVHTVMMTFVDGKRVIVAAPEAFNGEAQNQVWIIDAADPAAITTLGTWKLPGEHPFDEGYRFSTHNFNILDNRIYLAHFHAGAWVLDISTTAKLAAPEVVGYFLPTGTANLGESLGIPAVPLVWDVVPAKGKVMALDIATGFYVLEPAWTIPDELPWATRGA